MTPTSERIAVLVVDDHTMVRRGLATFLKAFDDMELAAEAASGQEAVDLCAELHPDVVLMDMVLPDIDGAAATRRILEQSETTQVIALTSFKEEKLVENALHAGAIGYLLKDVTAEELAQAIRAAHAGRATLSAEAAQALVEAASQPAPPGQDLTERELQVLALLVQGLTNRQIAGKLTVSPSTIKSHVRNIMTKLNVASRTEAVSVALRNDLLD